MSNPQNFKHGIFSFDDYEQPENEDNASKKDDFFSEHTNLSQPISQSYPCSQESENQIENLDNQTVLDPFILSKNEEVDTRIDYFGEKKENKIVFRTRHDPWKVEAMSKIFEDNLPGAYLNHDEYESIANDLDLSKAQVVKWFARKRSNLNEVVKKSDKSWKEN